MKRITKLNSPAQARLLLGILFAIVPAIAISHLQLRAQASTATISGTVVDQNDAAIPGAVITITNTNTNFQRQTTANDQGQFTIPLLPAATYTLTAQRDGFAPFRIQNVILNVNDQRSILISLKVGDAQSSIVDITTNDVGVNTSPSQGTVIDRGLLQSAPLSQRNVTPLILLTPGAVPTRATGIDNGQFSVNGQRANANYYTVDGVSGNIGVSTTDVIGQESSGSLPGLTTAGGTNNLVSLDALQEFKIETSTFAPEFGRTPGGQVTLVTRSGSTDFHATAFELFRNEVFDANDWFANRGGQKRAALRQNQFGATLSGPLPWLTFGEGGRPFGLAKNTFFFFAYEGLRLRQPQTANTTVPSLRLRQDAAPEVKPILNAIPLPTGPEILDLLGNPTGRSPLVATFSNPSNFDATSIRVDHNFSDHLNLFGRFNYSPSSTTPRSRNTPSALNPTTINTTTATVGSTMIFSPSTTNDLRFNYSKVDSLGRSFLDNFGGAVPFDPNPFFPENPPPGSQFFTIIFSSSFTVGNRNANTQKQINLIDTLSLVKGNHSLKFGVDYRRLMPVYAPRPYIQGLLFFSEAALDNGTATLAQVLASKTSKPVFNNFSAFAQDTWRASDRLTLTYGVRWELNPPPTDADGGQPFVFTNVHDPATIGFAPAGTPLWNTTYNNFAPRVGAAYTLSQKQGRETVLRGGFGVFYDLGNGEGAQAFASAPFQAFTLPIFNATLPLTTAQRAIPPFPTDASSSPVYAFDPDLKLPYTLQWNATIDQSLGKDQVLSVAYVAAAGRRQLRNKAFRSGNPTIFQYNLITSNGTSSYNSMQLQFTRRLARGLQGLASYTWSHAIDDASAESQDSFQQRADADFDVRHAFSAALTYDIPFRPKARIASAVLGGWSFDTIVHALSATPFTPIGDPVILNSGDIKSSIPNLVPGQPIYITDDNAPGGKRVNPAAFSLPAPGTIGNAPRNMLRGFPLYQCDIAVHKRFQFNDRAYLEFKTEAFNVFNHPNFDFPEPDLTLGNAFGIATQMLGRGLEGVSPIYQIGGPRSLQFGLKLGF